MTDILAWHGDPGLKTEVMARLRKHREQDDFIQGIYQRIDPERASGYRGCAIGCTLPLQPRSPDYDNDPTPIASDGDWHREIERLYGIPWRIACLIDDIFEWCDPDEAGDFAVDVIDAIEPGADLSDVSEWAKTAPVGDIDGDVLIEKLCCAPVVALATLT